MNKEQRFNLIYYRCLWAIWTLIALANIAGSVHEMTEGYWAGAAVNASTAGLLYVLYRTLGRSRWRRLERLAREEKREASLRRTAELERDLGMGEGR